MRVSNYELELYKIITENKHMIDEFGWESDTEFYILGPYYQLSDFMEKMINVFGYGMFDDGSFNANMRHNCVCIDLCEMVGDYVDVEDVFSKIEFQH